MTRLFNDTGMAYNVPGIDNVATEGSNVPKKAKGEARSVYAVLGDES
jgi:hypothetical protein